MQKDPFCALFHSWFRKRCSLQRAPAPAHANEAVWCQRFYRYPSVGQEHCCLATRVRLKKKTNYFRQRKWPKSKAGITPCLFPKGKTIFVTFHALTRSRWRLRHHYCFWRFLTSAGSPGASPRPGGAAPLGRPRRRQGGAAGQARPPLRAPGARRDFEADVVKVRINIKPGKHPANPLR